MRATAMAPSPTAEATRLIDPWRTSPATKRPGWLDSRNSGGRSSGHRGLPLRQQVRAGDQEAVVVAA